MDRRPGETPAPLPRRLRRSHLGLLLAIVGAGFCLRPPVLAIAPVLEQIGEDFGKSETWLGLLTALPLFCFGVAAMVAPALMRRFGDARLLGICLGLLIISQLLRLVGGANGMLFGTLLVGLTIGIANVIVPALIKWWFPEKIAVATSFYTLALSGSAALGAGLVLPIQDLFSSGWRFPFVVFSVPALVVALYWLIFLRKDSSVGEGGMRLGRLWKNRIAWSVTGYFGFLALGAYATMAWLPVIAVDRGMTAAQGGVLLAVGMTMQILGTLGLPILIRHSRDQLRAVWLAFFAIATGLTGLFFAPLGLIWGATIMLNIGCGAALTLSLALIGLRSADRRVAGELSGMTQSFGYMISALGPLGAGAVKTATGSWGVVGIALLVTACLMLAVGLVAARRGEIALD